MQFCTVINCMDGRAQVPVIDYLKKHFGVEYVDVITEAGVNRVVAEGKENNLLDSIWFRVGISLERHQSVGIAVAGHHDCAGNPVSRAEQEAHIRKSVEVLKSRYDQVPVIGLWVNSDWQVEEVE